MQTLTVVIASASGLALGYATAAHFASTARKSLQAKLKDETTALKEAQAKVKELKAGDSKKPTKGKAKKSDKDSKKLEKFEKQAAEASKEVERLKNAQMAADKAHADALSKVEAKLEEAQAEAAEAEQAAKEAAAEAAEAAKEAAEAPKEAEAASAEAAPEVNAALLAALEAAGTSLDEILKALVEHEGQTGALLGDMNGIVIAQAGDSETVDNTAAASNTIITLPQKLDGMLPLASHFDFRLKDEKGAITGHTFETQGELMAITTVGTRAPSEASLDAVVKSLNTALR